jgi:hypothetical protein
MLKVGGCGGRIAALQLLTSKMMASQTDDEQAI